MAAATMFQIPVYYISKTNKGVYKWHVIHPLETTHSLRYPPIIPEEPYASMKTPSRMEIAQENCHYDAIVSLQSSALPPTPPQLSQDISYIDLS